uniref:Vacuolar import/degradation Vid27 C-terminal domain-containing protein n=1 Tax=Auxenochlorella protothecoides TaxID=3075 RepID=A0A1D2AGF4_AUXPR
MGNSGSAPEPDTDEFSSPAPAQEPAGLTLYKGERNSKGDFQWKEAAGGIHASLYDANEDATGRRPEWHFELEGGPVDLNAVIDDDFVFDLASRRVLFTVDNTIWALHTPAGGVFEALHAKYERALFENKWGLEDTLENRNKIMGTDGLQMIGKETAESLRAWADDMDVDVPTAAELSTPPRERLVGRRDAIHGLVMGAGDRSYLIRDGEINVMRNVLGGMEDAAVKLSFGMPESGGTPGTGRRSTRRSSLGPAAASGGGSLTPSRALLMAAESKMAMLTPLRKSNLIQADIETGRVVSEWSFQKDGVDIPMDDIVGDTKASQLEDRQTFLGLGTNRLVRWDMRDRAGVVQEMGSPIVQYAGGKDYARNTNFTCMATSGDGYVVVGSQDGRVRLYSESTLTQARTSIPSLGYPITDVDVTYDGRWVVATAAHYLMVVMTTYRPPGSEATLCGFTSRMGANSPAPRLLRLRLEDALRTVNKGFMSNFCVIGHASMARPSRAMAGNVCAARRRRAFSRTQSDESLSTTHRLGLIPSQGNKPLQKGRFTWVTERGRQERWVVASCGSYTVRWNLRVVKTANAQTVSGGGLTTVDQYQLLSKEEHVVDSAFMHDNFARSHGESMVVVTDNHVYNINDDEDSS